MYLLSCCHDAVARPYQGPARGAKQALVSACLRGSTAGLYRADTSMHAIPCPLCEEPARVVDWPTMEWVTIEGCSCGGFAVWADLVATRRLRYLRPQERERLQSSVRDLRALNQDAWLVTADGRLGGRLIVVAERTDRSPRERRRRYE